MAQSDTNGQGSLALNQASRTLQDQAIEFLLREQTPEAVARQAEFVARNLSDHEDNSFMRP